jgi:hypothetical protein
MESDMANKQDEQQKQEKPSEGPEGGPMAMGMAMAEKMMGQMGAGGSPMEMMQKMMAQMGEGGKPPSMDKMMGMCMGMCSEMLNAIRQTNALAVHATPDLQHAFADWLQELESKALAAIGEGEKDAAALAAALKIGEDSSRYILTRLAAREAVTLTCKTKL